MSTSKAPLTHKLILVVLSLILICMALLVIQAFGPGRARPDMALDPDSAAHLPGDETFAGENRDVRTRPDLRNPNRALRSIPTNAPVEHRPPADLSGSAAGETSPAEAGAGTEVQPIAATAVSTVAAVAVPVVNEIIAPLVDSGETSFWGRVTLTGTVKPEIPIELGPSCGSLRPPGERPTTRHFVFSQDGGLANVFVFLHAKPQVGRDTFQNHLSQSVAPSFAPSPQPVLLDQVGCMFEPYVVAVQVGQPLHVRNSDPVLHNLHFTPRFNRKRNVGQPTQGQVTEFRFDLSELFIRQKCDLHPWMFSYVSVVSHPFFAITDAEGYFRIPPGMAPGSYAISAVHLRASGAVKTVQYVPGTVARVDFKLKAEEPVRQNQVVRSQ